MKIFFPEPRSGPLLTTLRGAPRIIWFIIICFLVGLRESYLLENHFGSLTIAALGIAGIFICFGGALTALLVRSQVDGARGTRIEKNVPRIKSAWDYRPREAIWRYAARDAALAETAAIMIPAPPPTNQENDIWFNFVSPDPTVEDARRKAPLFGPEPFAINNNVWSTEESYINA